MLKKSIITLAITAKALALAAAVMLYGASSTAQADDCPLFCVPPPCQENCDEGGEES